MNETTRLLPWAPERTGEAAPMTSARMVDPNPPLPKPAGTSLSALLYLPLRLAWRQLRAERSRLASAMAGVMFACVLVFMQLGFRAALFESATALLGGMRADIFLMHPLTTASFRPEGFPRSRAYQALADADVVEAVPIYLAQTTWRNPADGSRRAIQLVGFDSNAGALRFEGIEAVSEALKRPDTIAFDRRSRPEFGPAAAMFEAHGPFDVQLGGRMMELAGLVSIGASFGADGNAVLSETNFRRIMRDRSASVIDLAALKVREGADIATVVARLRASLPPDVMVFSRPELVAHERAYWENATPIGFIFAFGSLMGLIVGMVIVYQILFSDIANHIREYATLKAIGYSNGFLSRVVMGAALILAIIGFIPGIIVSTWLYGVVGGATFLPLRMEMERGLTVFGLILGMCVIAGLLAVRKLRDADPADMF
jgi:putative ABC transport system permease protein